MLKLTLSSLLVFMLSSTAFSQNRVSDLQTFELKANTSKSMVLEDSKGNPYRPKNSFCAITRIGGAIEGAGEQVLIDVDAKGRWNLKIMSGGSLVIAGARCFLFK